MELDRKALKNGVFVSVSISVVAIVIVVLLTQEDFRPDMFGQLDSSYLLLAFYVTVIFWLLKALKLKVLADCLGGSVSLLRVFLIYVASAFVAHITPSSSGGLPFIIYFIHREGLPLGKSTALTVLDGILNVIFFMIAAPVLLITWGEYLNLGPFITKLFYMAIGLIVAFIVVSLILIFNAHLAIKIIEWLISLKNLRKLIAEEKLNQFCRFTEREVHYFNEGLDHLMASKRSLALVLIYTVLYWLFYLSLPLVILRGLGLEIAAPPVILAQLVFTFIQPLIPTPGGSGGAELSFAYLFKFMVPNYLLGIFVALWRFFIFYFSLIVGGLFFLHLVKGTDYLE